VLIVSDGSLFGEGIKGLLRQEPGLEIVGREADPEDAVRSIRESHPDVIILTDGEVATGLGLELLGMVREGFRLRIVEVHLATNTLCLYCGEQQPIREVRDLVDTLGHICESVNRKPQVPLSPATGQPVV
jgi:DNA-binding NarL/FixJ family response regulator